MSATGPSSADICSPRIYAPGWGLSLWLLGLRLILLEFKLGVELVFGLKVKVAHTRLPSVGFPVLGSQPAGDMSHKPDGRLPLLSDRPAVTPATLNRAATNFAAW